MSDNLKIVALAGGVGGAKLADGLAQCLSSDQLTIIVNTGDDFNHLGLSISPDLDTVCYTLAGLANPQTGWGRKDESWRTLQEVKRLDGADWFNLGDLDLATHLVRTQRIQEGQTLSEITSDFCRRWGVDVPVYPMSDTPVRTFIHTKDGRRMPFQEYFVKEQCIPELTSIELMGIEKARAPEKALIALQQADCVIFCPSNPFVSIDPILAVPDIKHCIQNKKILAVSPLIGGKALKGPAAKMFRELGFDPNAAQVAKHYQSILSFFILDEKDKEQIPFIEGWGIICEAMNIFMPDRITRKRLARKVLSFLEKNI
ncbi:MAG TPA: 2-phospho-L-lactate transferase [Anaerolineaceae bacterium]|uniref:LPPG:FO 2-phospho-L-lactate transferase n=1 Tax=Anaerolinea thermophila TaxID=167964 RepID=A0A124FN23_9CHLR|nr:MAG: LPPG:FO 2-phospho-L-lactate transferase [Anaerolinea thermophila]HAF61246.1 2-phospho-L-lactate transferase [Anaerolineaceae bacterium]